MTAEGASLVCRVDSTRWPVSAAWMAISAVARSRISPTMMMSGSCRISARTPSANDSSMPAWVCTCIWLKAGSTISMGSSTVHTLTSLPASAFKVLYRVLVLPEPVGPVTSTMPCVRVVSWRQRSASAGGKPSSARLLTATSGSKMRMTSFSPKAVGKVDRRSSISCPCALRVLMRPSWGRRFSTTSMRPSNLMRAVMASMTTGGN
ncbi:hypothetical protein JAB5_51940 [Janthinobacterium sp. HH103]|nr:hypothetical protein JAB5_51940 [Janthinobacterium sp. HH103]